MNNPSTALLVAYWFRSDCTGFTKGSWLKVVASWVYVVAGGPNFVQTLLHDGAKAVMNWLEVVYFRNCVAASY